MPKYKEEVSITSLQEGKILFIYAERHEIYFIVEINEEGKKLYLITTDKAFDVVRMDEISANLDFDKIAEFVFFKPVKENTGDYIFPGKILYIDGTSQKFVINETLTFRITKDDESFQKHSFGLVNAISDIDIIRYIQKVDKIYFIGKELNDEVMVYGVVDIREDKLLRIYYLYSDYGDIIPMTISIDSDEKKVYIGGYIDDVGKEPMMYLESFLLQQE